MTLPFDVARCIGGNCEKKATCERFIELKSAKENTPIFDPFPDDVGDKCRVFLPLEAIA